MGLVAGIRQETGISQVVDECSYSESPDQIAHTGKALEAMILNGPGFVKKKRYLIPHFFRDKPIELILRPELETEYQKMAAWAGHIYSRKD